MLIFKLCFFYISAFEYQNTTFNPKWATKQIILSVEMLQQTCFDTLKMITNNR